jgi:hypothetical protein
MTLPIIGEKMTPPNHGLAPSPNAAANYLPITGPNITYDARQGHAQWQVVAAVRQLNIGAAGVINYRFIPAVQGQVSYCVVPGAGHANDIYIVSDQYGGCEYHTLYNAAHNMFAFLHVYRGGGTTVGYTLGAGWALQNVKRSAAIAAQFGMAGSNWSVTHLNRAGAVPIAHTEFVHINHALDVTGVSNGNAPYAIVPVVVAPVVVPAVGTSRRCVIM